MDRYVWFGTEGIVKVKRVKFNKRQTLNWNRRMKLWRKFIRRNWKIRKEALADAKTY